MNKIVRWIEHFFILPLRWLKIHCRVWKECGQRCKVCGCRDKFNFSVPDKLWKRVVPVKYRNRVVCLSCFDDFAKKKEIDYSTSIETLYFAGNQISMKFKQI